MARGALCFWRILNAAGQETIVTLLQMPVTIGQNSTSIVITDTGFDPENVKWRTQIVMETSMTISVHAQGYVQCMGDNCTRTSHVYVTIGKTTVFFCMECAVDSIQDTLVNMAVMSIG